jgi:integrase
MTRLTDRKIQSLKPRKRRYDVSDTDIRGLHVRVSELGTKSFVLVVRYPGAKFPARRSLGKYPEMTLAEAREKARQWRSMVSKGIDPKEEQRRLRLADAAKRANTVASVAEAYISKYVRNLKSSDQIEADIRRTVILAWGSRPITAITRGDVRDMIREIGARAPYSARNVFAATRAMFNWALHEDAYGLTANPCADIEIDKVIGQEKMARDRVLSDEEIRALWRACDSLGYPWGSCYKLLLLTGCRRAEISEARWSEFDEGARELRIPRDRTKTNEQHIVPLSAPAMDIIMTAPRISGSPYILSVSGHSPLAGHGDGKRKLDKLMARDMGCSPADFARGNAKAFVIHDLRRTVRTRLAELKVDFIVAEMILGHTLGGIHGTYNRFGYAAEKRDALEKLAAHIREIVGEDLTAMPLFATQHAMEAHR